MATTSTCDDPESYTQQSAQLKPLQSAKSWVWKYFGFKEGDNSRVFCKLCVANLSYCKNTTNMQDHMKRYHLEVYSNHVMVEKSSPKTTIAFCLSNSKPYNKTGRRFKECDNALVSFICKDMQPISIVESESFKSFVETLDPRYKMLSRNHYSRLAIPQKYEEVKSLVQADLDKAEHICVTTDMWTGCHQRSYMSLSAHFVTEEWQLKHFTLETREVTSSHEAENLATELKKSFEQWMISEKVFTITTDNASNITNAVVKKLELPHLGCFGHTLQLSIGKAFQLNQVARILGRVRKLVRHFHMSTKEMYALREKQIRLQLPQLQLIQECVTRWGSTYLMLQRVQEQQPAICAVLMENKDRAVRNLFPDSSEWAVIEELSGILKPFYDATTIMSASKYPTHSLLAPLFYKLLKITLKINLEDSSTLKSIKKAISSDLEERYCNTQVKRTLLKAAFLDPRFKSMDPYVNKEKQCDVIEDVKTELVMMMNLTTPVAEENLDDTNDEMEFETTDHLNESSTNDAEPPSKKKCTHLFIPRTNSTLLVKKLQQWKQ